MVREIVHDPMFLQRKSEDATQADLQTAQDLLDTLRQILTVVWAWRLT